MHIRESGNESGTVAVRMEQKKNQMRKAEIHSGCDVLHAVCMAGGCGDILCAGRSDNEVKTEESLLP